MKKETIEEAAERFIKSKNFKSLDVDDELFDAILFGYKFKYEVMYNEVNRVEVIQHSEPYNGRAYTNYNAKDVEVQLQDDGKTLKIFLK
jgi:hypothetical protein